MCFVALSDLICLLRRSGNSEGDEEDGESIGDELRCGGADIGALCTAPEQVEGPVSQPQEKRDSLSEPPDVSAERLLVCSDLHSLGARVDPLVLVRSQEFARNSDLGTRDSGKFSHRCVTHSERE